LKPSNGWWAGTPTPCNILYEEVEIMRGRRVYWEVVYILLAVLAMILASGAPVNFSGPGGAKP